MPFNVPNPFGRYSLPNVLGRLFHHGNGGNTGVVPPSYYPVTQVGGLTQGGFNGSNDYTPGAPYTNPNVGNDPTATPGGNFTTPHNNGGNTGIVPPSSNTGGQWGGVLGSGTALDPSAWGGLFDNGAGDSTRYYATQQGHTTDGSGIAGGGRGLIGTGFFNGSHHGMHTGGNDPSYDSSGINPGGMYTGGNQQAHPLGMQTGGVFPAQPQDAFKGLMGNKQPPGGLIR